jgi:DUF1680 family protein
MGACATVAGLAPVLSPLDALATNGTKAARPAENGKTKFASSFYATVPPDKITPSGWLSHQLEIMRDGTTGHLDEVYAKLRDDNGWLGGKGDGWEETPYWLDGAVPLAFLLKDDALKRKVSRYVNWVLDHQRPSGYFGPITKAERERHVQITPDNPGDGEDWWPKMVMLKVLRQYYLATGDERVIPFLHRYFRYQLSVLKKCPLGKWTQWAESRGIDNTMVVQWLYGETGQSYLLELAELIESQSFPWSDWFDGRDWVIHAAARQDGVDWMHRHGVNVAMALKAPAVHYQRTGDKRYLQTLKTVFGDLMTLHGLPHGMFSADEDLHGNDPVQGVELCAIVETMFSLEQSATITGETGYMDAVEKIAFNALPTQTTDDYNNKQYFQIANQVHVCKGVFEFSLPFSREMNNVFGMRSGYTCCLANMHQGWTKFASSLWHATADKGLAALLYAPNEITIKTGDKDLEVTITERTGYPFTDQVHFLVSAGEPVEFPLYLRIPGWCDQARVAVNGTPVEGAAAGKTLRIKRSWKEGDQVALTLPMRPATAECGRNGRAVERGPLVYALKQQERWEKGTDEKEGDFYSVYPEGDWNYGLLKKAVDDPERYLEVRVTGEADTAFVWNLAHAPVEISAPAKKIPGWSISNGVAHAPVTDRTGIYRGQVADREETITLVPYGCTKVRVVAFPVVS